MKNPLLYADIIEEKQHLEVNLEYGFFKTEY